MMQRRTFGENMKKKLPIVAIVGRQNVGKSTLFNALTGKRRAIVDAHPGLTRDILFHEITHGEKSFLLSDTPGLDLIGKDELSEKILLLAHKQIAESAVILLLLENPGPENFDHRLVDLIRQSNIPAIIAVNKMDNEEDFANLSNFYEIGLTDIVPVSALRKRNTRLLLDKIVSLLPKTTASLDDIDIKIAIVGRPNSGKSTLLNAFAGYERSVVSDVPGTTRDTVDEDVKFHGKLIRFIDTAGMRRKRNIDEPIEFFSITRTREAIRRCDVTIHLIDATIGLTENDKKISDEILECGKTPIIALNKWDAIEKNDKTFNEYKEKISFKYYRALDFPVISISALEKQRVHKLITTALEIHRKSLQHIPTAELNRTIEQALKKHKHPLLGNSIKIFYATQTGSAPPKFRLFTNNPESLKRKDILRYFEKIFKQEFRLEGILVAFEIEGRGAEKKFEKSKKK
jgi:GTP-binding protein